MGNIYDSNSFDRKNSTCENIDTWEDNSYDDHVSNLYMVILNW